MNLSEENKERYWALVHGLIAQVEENVKETPEKSIETGIFIVIGHSEGAVYNEIIKRIYIDDKDFLRAHIDVQGEYEDEYFDSFSLDELLTIVNSI